MTEEELDREPSVGGPAGLAVAVLVVGLATRSLWFARPVKPKASAYRYPSPS